MEQQEAKEVSKLIWKSYQYHGRNSNVTNMAKNMALTHDCIWNCRMKWEQHSSGSSVDGTCIYGTSDVDEMRVISGIVVTDEQRSSTAVLNDKTTCDKTNKTPICSMSAASLEGKKQAAILYMDTSKSHPGYVRLIPESREALKPVFSDNVDDVLEEKSGVIYLSSEKFVQFMISRYEPCHRTPNVRHGPSLKMAHDNIYGYHMNKADYALEHDIAYAIAYDKSPVCMQEWISRSRKFNWPSSDMVEKIKKFPCHFVPVGDTSSMYYSLEWRISFLLGERELAWCFNDTQTHCLIILKKLRTSLIEPLFPDQVTSYNLKTIVYWLSEEKGIDVWVPEHLLARTADCLIYLIGAIKERDLPHYFQRDRNLFKNKLTDKTDKDRILCKITEIRNNMVDYILRYGMPDESFITKTWNQHRGDINILIEACKKNQELNQYFWLVKKMNDQARYNQAISNIFTNITDACDPLSQLLRISKALDEAADINLKYKGQILKTMDIQIGLRYQEQYLYEVDVLKKETLLTKTRFHLEKGASFDNFTGILYLASFQYSIKEYQSVIDTISDILNNKNYLLYTGKCSPHYGMELGMPGGEIYQTLEAPITLDEDDEIQSAFDFVYSKTHIACLPYPLQIECAMMQDYGDSLIIIHPAVYAFFLLFMSNIYSGNSSSAEIALKHLEEVIDDIGDNLHRYRSLNLLGYCYSACKKINEAVECYKLSLKHTTRLPNVKNAAIYHVAFLVYYTFKFFEYYGLDLTYANGYEESNVESEVIYNRE